MNFLEKDLEKIIYESTNEELLKRGLEVVGIPKRQLLIGRYGIADLIYFKRDYHLKEYYNCQKIVPFLQINILELKKDKIGISSLLQSLKYARGIQRYFEINNSNINFKIRITLIGKYVDKSGSFAYLPDLFQNVDSFPSGNLECIDYYTYKYNIDGLSFKHECNYKLGYEGLKNRKNGKR